MAIDQEPHHSRVRSGAATGPKGYQDQKGEPDQGKASAIPNPGMTLGRLFTTASGLCALMHDVLLCRLVDLSQTRHRRRISAALLAPKSSIVSVSSGEAGDIGRIGCFEA